MYGKNAIAANGGNGGVGGTGGKAGEVHIIALNKRPKFIIVKKDGESGLDGRGAKGTPRMKNGDKITFNICNAFKTTSTIQKEEGSFIEAGKDGIDGFNRKGMQQMEIDRSPSPNVIIAINNYRNFVKDHIDESIIIHRMLQFLKRLDEIFVFQ